MTLVTPMHPLRYQERNLHPHADGSLFDIEYDKPITIGDNCWFGSNVTVIGGMTIGSGCVIGAGSVVTRDIPAHSLAVGNPLPRRSRDYGSGLDSAQDGYSTITTQKHTRHPD